MNDEHRRIIIKRISSYDQQGDDSQGNPPPSPINRWVALALLIPALAVMAVLGVFFFTIFVALFSIIAVVIGARIWWLRRKFRKAMQEAGATQDGQPFEYAAYSEHEKSGQYERQGGVEDAEIIEETTIIRESKKTDDDDKQ